MGCREKELYKGYIGFTYMAPNKQYQCKREGQEHGKQHGNCDYATCGLSSTLWAPLRYRL